MNSHLRRKARRLAARRWKAVQEVLKDVYGPALSSLLGRRAGMSEGSASAWLAVQYGKSL